VSRKLSDDPKAAPHPDDWGPRVFTNTGFSAYRMTAAKGSIVFDVTRLRRERDELIGELVVRCDFAGARTHDGILSAGDWNLSSVQARNTRAKHLEARAQTRDVDWEGWLQELAFRVLEAERTGHPAELLADIPIPPNGGELEAHGLVLPRRDPAILFGDGGSAKSLLSLAVACELVGQGEIVMYCDWEATGADHRQRLDLLYPSQPPPILYTRCERPLVVEIDRLRAIALEHGVTYAILDRAAYGCQGAPESAEAAIGYFRGIRSFGNIGTLIIAHVTKAEDGDKRPFGSGFWHNSSRSTYHVRRSNPDDDGSHIDVLLSQRKCNNGRLRSPFALQIHFGETILIHRSSPHHTPEFATSLTLMQRIRAAVSRQPLSKNAIQDALDGEKPDSIRRMIDKGVTARILTRLEGPDGKELIGLKYGES
jgi:hypothetical protein